MNFFQNIAVHTWTMIAEMGAFLLLGFVIAALLHKLLRQSWIEGLMGQRKLSSIVWGSVVGVPMPLCSCGVIPVTMSLRAKGASRGATVSFLTSTPQTGVDSFLATYAMLGPVFAVYKVIVAFLSGILVGLTTDLLSPPPSSSSSSTPSSEQSSDPDPAEREKRASHERSRMVERAQPAPTWPQSIRYGLVTMPAELASALIIGFILAGLISALAPADLLANIPGGAFSAILLATVISVPFYICSTGSIPLALALVQSGLPISAVLVLLIAGHSTNVATITTMRKVLGGRSTLIYVLGVILATWIAAAVYHFLLDTGSLGHHATGHEMELPLWKHLGGIILLALLILPYLAQRLSPKTRQPIASQDPLGVTHAPGLHTATIKIEGMTCGHCESSVRHGLSSLPFAANVLSVDRASNSAIIQARSIDEPAIRQKLESLGFEYKGTTLA